MDIWRLYHMSNTPEMQSVDSDPGPDTTFWVPAVAKE
jgi:hypothetical protein